MDLTQVFIEKAKQKPLRIVFPEGDDSRIVIAASTVKQMGIASPIVLGESDSVKKIAADNKVSLEGIDIINPASDPLTEKYTTEYAKMRDMKPGIARKMVQKVMPFGGMMVKMGDADGMVGGVATATATVIQAASLTVGYQQGLSTPSSFFIMIIPEFQGEKDKPILFADCAVNIQPTAQQLAEIAVASGRNARALLGLKPKIAFLSFSTKGSASHADADKVIQACAIARRIAPDMDMDGEMQGDAALIEAVAKKKVKESSVAGQANVLIFPDLDAGNIGYKLVERLAKAKAFGPILQGFAAPVNDMSRGASVDDLVGVTAITVIQAQQA